MAGTRRRPKHLEQRRSHDRLEYTNADGSDVTQRTVTKPAFSNDLLEQVLTRANLQAAWKHVRANKGAAGIDGITIDEFPVWARMGHWQTIVEDLELGRY